jgi:hypothetical protein
MVSLCFGLSVIVSETQFMTLNSLTLNSLTFNSLKLVSTALPRTDRIRHFQEP